MALLSTDLNSDKATGSDTAVVTARPLSTAATKRSPSRRVMSKSSGSVIVRTAEDGPLSTEGNLPNSGILDVSLGVVIEQNYAQQITHDIRHELSTISLLTSLICASKDIGPDARSKSIQLLSEIAWLDELIRFFDDTRTARLIGGVPNPQVALDKLVTAIVATIRSAYATRITLDVVPVHADIDRLALWRVLRNLLCNALSAAGPEGCVAILVRAMGRCAYVEINDDGPGFAMGESRGSRLGLGIVRDIAAEAGARVEIGSGALGGCRVRLLLPSSSGHHNHSDEAGDASLSV